MKNYNIRFSLKGLIAFVIIMLPNIIWMIKPPGNDFMSSNSSTIDFLNISMVVSQWIMIIGLIMLCRTEAARSNHVFVIVSLLCAGIYYVLWVCYYLDKVRPLMFIGMAVFPCCYFIAFILWQKIYLLLIPTIIFSILHIGITVSNVI